MDAEGRAPPCGGNPTLSSEGMQAPHPPSAPAARCPPPPHAVFEAEGRTFPVSALFLEDVYQETQYRLAPDAPAAMRGGKGRASASAMRKNMSGGSR